MGYSPVAGTRQTLGSTTSTIIFSMMMLELLALMETFFLFWCSVVGLVVEVLMVGLLMVVDILCIDEELLTRRPVLTVRMKMKHVRTGNAGQHPAPMERIWMEHAKLGMPAHQHAPMVRMKMEHAKT